MILAATCAVFVWWFSTGALIWVVGRHRRQPGWLVGLSAPLAVLAGVLLVRSSADEGVAGAYAGFVAAIAVWGWFELAFLAGVITGPSRAECPPGARGFRRFRAAWNTIAHHELALLGAVLLLVWLSWGQANQTGLWTFLVLFAARISAKLNVYLGTPNLSDELLPEGVAHLRSYFAKRPMNLLFPVSITALTFAVACWAERAHAAPAGSGAEIGFVLLAALTAIALVEHWLMVLPVSETALWGWFAPKSGGQEGRLPTRGVVGPAE